LCIKSSIFSNISTDFHVAMLVQNIHSFLVVYVKDCILPTGQTYFFGDAKDADAGAPQSADGS